VFAPLAPGPQCDDNASWCPQIFAGQCYDHSVERVCCRTCARHRTSTPGQLVIYMHLLLLLPGGGLGRARTGLCGDQVTFVCPGGDV